MCKIDNIQVVDIAVIVDIEIVSLDVKLVNYYTKTFYTTRVDEDDLYKDLLDEPKFAECVIVQD